MRTDHLPRRSLVRLTCAALAIGAALCAVALAAGPTGTSKGPQPRKDVAAAPAAERLTSRPWPTPAPLPAVKVGDELRTGAGQRRRVGLPDGSVLYVNENTQLKIANPRTVELAAGEVYVEETAQPFRAPLEVRAPGRQVRGNGAGFGVRVAQGGTSVIVARGEAVVGDLAQRVRAGQQVLPGAKEPAPAPRASVLLDWTRELRAADTPLVPGSGFSGGALVVKTPEGQEAKLTLRKYHIDVHIEDGFARTTIDQTYFNGDHAQLEGTFYFPLPPDATLSHLAMYVDGNLMEGGMVERELGRTVYETIRYRNRDPALLEWLDGSTFKMRVFPVEGRQEKRLLLSYTQRLPSLYGQVGYRFPAGHTLPEVRDWSFRARVKDGAALSWASPSHGMKPTKEGGDLLLAASAQKARFDKDVVLTLGEPAVGGRAAQAVRFDQAEQDGQRYLMMRLRPELLRPGQPVPLAREREPRHWVFLFESSGDRDPLLARVQVEVVRGLLSQLDRRDTFAVLAAGTRVRAFAKEPTEAAPESVQAAVTFLENSHLIGALDMGHALAAAGTCAKEGKDAILVHVGSGIAAMGERRDAALIKSIPEGTRYVGVGVGRRWARSLMKAAAVRTGGYFAQVNPDEPVSWRVFELASVVQTLGDPLGNVELSLGAECCADGPGFLYYSRALAPGEEVCAIFRQSAKEKLPPEVTVTVGGQDIKVPVKDVAGGADVLPRMWAKLEIDRLLAEDAAKHKAQIIALSKAMYVVTPFTSLIVLENEDMYTQFKVERNRKDRWAPYPASQKIEVVYEPDPDVPDMKALLAGKRLPARQLVKTVQARQGPRLIERLNTKKRLRDAESFRVELLDHMELAGPVADATTPLGVAAFGRPMRESEFAPSLDLALDVKGAEKLGLHFGMSFRNGDANGVVYSLGAKQAAGGLAAAGGAAPRDKAPAPVTADSFQVHIGGRVAGEFGWAAAGDVAVNFATEKVAQLEDAVLLREHAARLNLARRGAISREDESLRSVNNIARGTNEVLGEDRNGEAPASGPGLLYQRPGFSGQDRIFFDLVAYAPGLNTTYADMAAVVEAEGLPSKHTRSGQVDDAVRRLIDRARAAGWRSYTAGEEGKPGASITFDGKGRFAYQRTLPPGLRERVACDGETLIHVYAQLGLGARRQVGRAHRADLFRLVPWAVPPADDLARGADLKAVGKNTVAVVPLGADDWKDDKGKPLPYARLHLVFGEDGDLQERQLVKVPEGKVLMRQILSADGGIRVLDKDGKEAAAVRGKLSPAEAPDLSPDVKGLVVLPLPYRTREYLVGKLKLQKTGYPEMRFADALQLLAADFAAGNAGEMLNVFRNALHAREQRQLGYYVLLAAAGHSLDGQGQDVLAEHPDEPLAQYLMLHSSPVLRKHASQWAVGSVQWNDPMLQHLALTHALYQRWADDRVLKGSPARVRADQAKALEYVRKHKDDVFGWALLCLLQDRAGKDKEAHAELAEYFKLFEDRPALAYAARYEQARCLYKSGQSEEARKRFGALYERTLKDDVLPAIDGDFQAALQGDRDSKDLWGETLQGAAAHLARQKHRPAAFALARQAWQLGDPALANQLVTLALDGAKEEKGRVPLTLAAVAFYQETSQLPQADELLQGLLAEPKQAVRADLWRLAAKIAEGRDNSARALECLERALDAEFQKLPETIDVQAVRTEYGKLLAHYQSLADAMNTLKVKPPEGFAAKVVRAADRWRALDQGSADACQATARILRALGARELGWEYLTTPVAFQPSESGPWSQLAAALKRTGDRDLADRALRSACEAEPTNADLLWERAENLRQAGRAAEARGVLRRIAEGSWQPRFQPTQARARATLGAAEER